MMDRKILKNKKAYFFSVDALIALLLILGVVIFIKPSTSQISEEVNIHEDLLSVLSSVKIGDLEGTAGTRVKNWIAGGVINNTEQSVLEQISEFYALGNDENAIFLIEDIFVDLDLGYNIAFYLNNHLIGSSNSTSLEESDKVWVSRQLVSGIEEGNGTKGFSSRASLFAQNKINYFYFGGYVGDGNITVYLGDEVTSAKVEGMFNQPFQLYINGNYNDTYVPTPGVPFVLDNIDGNFLVSNPDTLEFRSVPGSTGNLNIAGGYVKAVYNSTLALTSDNKKYLPGIDGLINIYDSFYVPGILNNMEISLHYDSPYSIFLTIGNKTIYTGNTSGDETIVLNDSDLDSTQGGQLDYSGMNERTIPFRIGLENVSYNYTVGVDIFSVTDLSGSMGWCSEYYTCSYDCWLGGSKSCSTIRFCDSHICGGTCLGPNGFSGSCPTTSLLSLAKDANLALIEDVLNETGNRVGLVGYESGTSDSDFHSLSADKDSLMNVVNTEWDAEGGTCICCGINRAVQGFLSSTSDGPVLYYDFNNDVLDNSGNGNDGTLNGGNYIEGLEDEGLEFDGNDWVGVSNTEDINLGTHAERSISVWFNISNKDLSQKQVIYEEGGSTRGLNIYVESGILYVGGWNEPSSESDWDGTWLTTSAIQNNVWHHVVLVLDGTSSITSDALKAYLDGAEFDSGEGSQLWGHSGDIQIGRNGDTKFHDGYDGSDGEYFTGVMDNFLIYNSVLTDTQINNMYNQIPVCGNGVVEVGEECDDGNLQDFDGCDAGCRLEQRYESMIVMSDGESNYECSQQGTGDPKDDAREAACDAYNNHRISVYAVGFGAGVDEVTLRAIADCGNGDYYYGDVEDIVNLYRDIAEDIIKAAYAEQTVLGEGIDTEIFSDSYIFLNYTRNIPHKLIVSTETEIFGADHLGEFNLPAGEEIYEANVVSYSGTKWTDDVRINNSVLDWQAFFNLTNYATGGVHYIDLGDPYVVNIPLSMIEEGENQIRVNIGLNTLDSFEGSEYNKIIYSVTKNPPKYSGVRASAEGCIWTIEFDDGSSEILRIPEDYSGPETCGYTSSNCNIDETDAINEAVFYLLETLDLNKDCRVESKFTENDLSINSFEVEGIPYMHSAEAQVRVWR